MLTSILCNASEGRSPTLRELSDHRNQHVQRPEAISQTRRGETGVKHPLAQSQDQVPSGRDRGSMSVDEALEEPANGS